MPRVTATGTATSSDVYDRLSSLGARIERLDALLARLYDERVYWCCVVLVAGDMRADVAYMAGPIDKETLGYAIKDRTRRLDRDRADAMRGRSLADVSRLYLELVAKRLADEGAPAGTLGLDPYEGDVEQARRKVEACAGRIGQTEHARKGLVDERNAIFLEGLAAGLTGARMARAAGVTPMMVSQAKRKARANG